MKYELSPEEAEAFLSKMNKFEAGLAREYGEDELSLARSLLHDLIASVIICAKSENVSPDKIIRCIQALLNGISCQGEDYRAANN